MPIMPTPLHQPGRRTGKTTRAIIRALTRLTTIDDSVTVYVGQNQDEARRAFNIARNICIILCMGVDDVTISMSSLSVTSRTGAKLYFTDPANLERRLIGISDDAETIRDFTL